MNVCMYACMYVYTRNIHTHTHTHTRTHRRSDCPTAGGGHRANCRRHCLLPKGWSALHPGSYGVLCVLWYGVCMCVCVCVCMYVCIYVCMAYACMYVCTYGVLCVLCLLLYMCMRACVRLCVCLCCVQNKTKSCSFLFCCYTWKSLLSPLRSV